MSTSTPGWAIFRASDRMLAVPAGSLQEVLPLPALDPVRDGSFALRGTMRYRERQLPVLGGRRLLGLPPSQSRSSKRPFWSPDAHIPSELAAVMAVRGRLFAVAIDALDAIRELPGAARAFHPGELAHLSHMRRLAS